MIYWPEFDFSYSLDTSRLLPHIVAIEACKEAAANPVLPSQWREQSQRDEMENPSGNGVAESELSQSSIAIRKQELLERNTSPSLTWVRQRFAPGRAAISMPDILHLHRMVADESGVYTNVGGVLRTTGVEVGCEEAGGLHAGAPPHKLPRLMDQYVSFIDDASMSRFPAVIHALVAHFFFTTIHPFDDGNGRVCRLISAAILFQRGYNGHGFYAFSNHFHVNALKYHTLLHRCWQQPLPFEVTEFVAFGMEGLAAELQGINSFIKVRLHRTADRQLLTPGLRQRRGHRAMQ
ncbi:MAG TPA: Fic family protein [Candidatus Angelobacter sp.]